MLILPCLLLTQRSPAMVGATTGSAQHAARHPAAHSFPKPTVSVDIGYALDIPSSIDVSGQGFTSDDPLHLQLIASDGPSAGSVLAEGDTTATPDAYLPQGDGQDILVPGGQFAIRLTASSAPPLLCQAMTSAVVTVVDTATGESASSYGVDISGWGCASPPTITAREVNTTPWSSEAQGTGFMPGGTVHIDLEIAIYRDNNLNQRGPFQPAGSLDTTAATATYASSSHGIVYTPGGYFAVPFGLDPAGPGAVCTVHNDLGRNFDWYVVATDVATGRTATSPVYPALCDPPN